jgi:histidinol-phosphate aminotransferase
VLGAGSSEIIDLLVRTFVAPGEEVVIAVPTFSMYEARTRTRGRRARAGADARRPGARRVGAASRAVTERTKLVFLCSPNNPTGNVDGRGGPGRVLRLGIPVVVDEAYVEFGDGRTRVALIAENPNLIVLRTFSKAFGLAGLRVGYALAPPVSRLLSPGQAPVERLHRRPRRPSRRPSRCSTTALPNVTAMASEGNFVLVDLGVRSLSSEQVVARMLTQGVLIRSLATHHANKNLIRITVGTPEQNERCVSVLTRVLTDAAAARLSTAGSSQVTHATHATHASHGASGSHALNVVSASSSAK